MELESDIRPRSDITDARQKQSRDDLLIRRSLMNALSQLLDGFLHELGADSIPVTILEDHQLPENIDRMQPRDSWNLRQTVQVVAMTDIARDGLPSTAFNQRLSFGNTPGGHIHDESGVR